MSIYTQVKRKIRKKKGSFDHEDTCYYTGYITSLRDFELLNKLQVKKLDKEIRRRKNDI